MTNTGHTKSTTLNEKPADMIHAVNVVPILAPILTLMAWPSDSNIALTNETVMTVVADEDWTATVISMPVKTPAKRLLVMADNV